PAQIFNKGWRLSNCGNPTWSGYQAVRVRGKYGPPSSSIPTARPGPPPTFSTDITAPTSAGTYRATYRLQGPNGQFGDQFWVEIEIGRASCRGGSLQADVNDPDGRTVS